MVLILFVKALLILATSVPNVYLFKKIYSRSLIHNIFNVSLACRFLFIGLIGPLLVHFYFLVINNMMYGQNIDSSLIRRHCAYFIDARNMALVAEQIIGQNLFFRFFYIVHAEKGFVSNGIYNSRTFNICFLLLTATFGAYLYLPYFITSGLEENYPENTVKGRICMGRRLDWKEREEKITSDVYVKPRLIIITFMMISIFFHCYLCGYQARRFITHFCQSQQSFASIGGSQRRNVFSHGELLICQWIILSFVLLENILIIIFYHFQDCLGTENVFIIHLFFCSITDFLMIIILPIITIFRSLRDYPELWTKFEPKSITFYISQTTLIPRRDPSECFWSQKDIKRKLGCRKVKRTTSRKKNCFLINRINILPAVMEEFEEPFKPINVPERKSSALTTVDIV